MSAGAADDRGLELTVASAAAESVRFHALDRVRALAMLLGVVYHTMLFRIFTGGGFPTGASRWLGDWLHSFRMPLFFLIAGFFGRMMLMKYGTGPFLQKRWYRIGIPLFVGMFTFGPIYVLTRDLASSPPSFGPGPGPGPGFGPPPMSSPSSITPSPEGASDGFAGMPGPPGGPRVGGPPPFGPPGGGGLARKIFGPYTRFVQLNHLWFLWYLLIFITVAPFLTSALAWAAGMSGESRGDRIGLRSVRWGLAPILLAIISTPALLVTSSPFGAFLGIAGGIFQAFPDFLYRFDPDMAFYFAYFLFGWWLHRERDALPSLARAWLPNLIVGIGAIWAAFAIRGSSEGPGSQPLAGNTRVLAYSVYCLGSACTSFAVIGVFLRYFDFPSRTWRYLADTALWVYLIHQPLVLLGLAACRPLNLPWWALTAVVSASSVLAALLLYEAVVRHTPLVRVFGPANPRRTVASKEVGQEVAQAVV